MLTREQHGWVYDLDRAARDAGNVELFGSKGSGLARMYRLHLPVPPALIITTEVGAHVLSHETLPTDFFKALDPSLHKLERKTKCVFGSITHPLLVSVRSAAAVSMPGMLDTVLNVGMTSEFLDTLNPHHTEQRFYFEAYNRFLHMYGGVVLGIERSEFERVESRIQHGTLHNDVRNSLAEIKDFIQRKGPFSEDPREQLTKIIEAVLLSWNKPRAQEYRQAHDLKETGAGACIVQQMVFGHRDARSGTGVALSRDPTTGVKTLAGEFLSEAQGEDVVAGLRTPHPIRARDLANEDPQSMEAQLPAVTAELEKYAQLLESKAGAVQEIEFTVESGKLFLLQTRDANLSPEAQVRSAVEMAREELIDAHAALVRVDPLVLEPLVIATLPPVHELEARGVRALGRGLGASPGAGVGRIVLDAEEAQRRSELGQKVILVRPDTHPDEVRAMKNSEGVLAASGGLTSHAAVVARGLKKPCVVGCRAFKIDMNSRQIVFQKENAAAITLDEGEVITIDGATGLIYRGALELHPTPRISELDELLEWADKVRGLDILATVNSAEEARTALSYGASGVGLCRTEHMFFAKNKLLLVRRWMLSDDPVTRQKLLHEVFSQQEREFMALIQALRGRPLTIRLLDWALDRVLPRSERELEELSQALGISVAQVRKRISGFSDHHPLIGRRGVRLGIARPELYAAQMRSIVEAIQEAQGQGHEANVELLIPMVSWPGEIRVVRELLERVLKKAPGIRLPLGVMIETPRACIIAQHLLDGIDFVCFGSNDLSELSFGASEADMPSYWPQYLEHHIANRTPFEHFDYEGVGVMMSQAIAAITESHAKVSLRVAGAHSRDPEFVAWCALHGVDAICVEPSKVPLVRLAAAQAAIHK